MIHESRCGSRCNACLRRASVECKGCTNMLGTFWGGECKVKKCCEYNKFEHCGQCPKFPCALLLGDGNYDPTEKIRQLRKWNREDKAAQKAAQ